MSRRSFLGILLAIVVSTAAQPTHAATIAVTTTVDELNTDGDCSLREAVQAANTNVAVDACAAGQGDQVDTIIVPAGTYTLTLAGTEGGHNADDNTVGDLDIKDAVTITGAGAATTIIQACDVEQQVDPCPAGHGVADRVFDIGDSDATISGVTIRHGRTDTQPGQGILVREIFQLATAALTLTDAVVTKNGTTSTAFAIVKGGGIAVQNAATATLTRVTVSDNILGSSGGSGGGIGNDGDAASLVMTDCTVSGNRAGNSGGGISNNKGSAIITGTTINGNTAVEGSGGGFISSLGTVSLTNCTVSGNDAKSTGGGLIISGIFQGPTSLLSSCTITLNHLGSQGQGGGGLYGSGVVLRNTILAGNLDDTPSASGHSPDCRSAGISGIVSEGHNLVGEGLHCVDLVDGFQGDQIGTQAAPLDAKLGPLADNGGPTLTHALLENSPAIDAADPGVPGSGDTACPATDQRGEPRPSGGACDIGSFEGGSGGSLAVQSVQPATGGNAGTVQMQIHGSGFVTGATVTLVRAGFPDVIGSATGVLNRVVTTSFDLHAVAPGVWSVVVKNPDQSTGTLTDAFTVVAGGGSDVWVQLVTPPAFNTGRVQSIYLLFGNRGTVDAYGVPLWLAFSEALRFFVPFVVSPPPAQPGQIATDWSQIGIDVGRPPSPEIPEQADSFHFLLPIVPAGSSNALRIRVKSPLFHEPTDPGVPASFNVATNIGAPYFQPDLPAEVVAFYVSQAKQYAVRAHGTTTFPADAAIAAYVRTQLATVVADGRVAAVANATGNLPVYSQAQLIIDTGQFITGESATASATSADRDWLARIVEELVVGSAEAYRVPPNPCAGFTDAQDKLFCEAETDPCRNGCPDDAPLIPPTVPCEGSIKVVLDLLGVPCKPTPIRPPFHVPLDPNYKAGPGGPGGFIDGVTPLPYTITFENLATASGDAFEVTVTDQLDLAKYDLDTFSLGPISFADKFVPMPPGLKSFSTEVDMRPGVNILVGIDAALDTATGIVTWKFTTLDPATHKFPEDPVDGFLPPNVTSPEGEAEMLFTVSLKPGVGLGTTVCNDASIVFDFNPAIVTNDFCNTIGAPEDCENCIDDDGDGKIDRADPGCAPPANGAGAGVGDATVGKVVDKCAKAIRKVGSKLASNRLKQLGACEKAVADCVQLKPGDAKCLTKAQGKCTKARTALPGAEAKLTAAITKNCGEPTVTAANLLAAAGLGFDGETGACEDRGLAAVATVADVAECVRRQHECAAERALGAAVPRARELLVLGGFDPAVDFSCLAATTNGGGSAIAAEKRKALRKCDGAIQKATAKLLAGRTTAGQACGGAVFSCVQTKPGDPACVSKAGATCTKAIAALPKLQASFTAAIAKSCGAPLVPADLLASEGLGVAGLAASCVRLGVPSLASVADVSACLERQLSCRADQLLESTTPRLEELLGLGGVALP